MKLALILGDQLSLSISSLQHLNKDSDVVLMAEVGQEATYVAHHKQKIALIFSAMRHFAEALRDAGWQVHYHYYDENRPTETLLDVACACTAQYRPAQLVVTECGESRLHVQMTEQWQQRLGIPLLVLSDARFFCSKAEFAQWAEGRKQLRMEYFYRDMRRKSRLLMEQAEPAGGQWNFDSDNRKAYRGEPPLPSRPVFERDDIDREVLALVERCFGTHPGTLHVFNWPTTRAQALVALDAFIGGQLAAFGDYQDAMQQSEHFMFHSLL
ncbi:MAG: hypothetical protein RLZZ227_2115, partial [Pseudomonadota bacterium]